MKKIILLGSTGTISTKVSMYLFIGLGLMYSLSGIPKLLEDGITFMSVVWMFTGLFFIIYAIFTFAITPITPKVNINEAFISYRKSPFGKTHILKWSEIKSIEFAAYQIIFHLVEHEHTFNYEANSSTSIEIKSSIREVAESSGIDVTGG